MNRIFNKKALIILASVILFDIVTKMLALNLLPFQENVYIIHDKLSFYLTYNEGSTNVQADLLLNHEQNKNLTVVMIAIAFLVLILYIFIINKKNLTVLYKWIIGICLYIFLMVLIEHLKLNINIEISNWTASLISKIVGVLFYLTFYFLAKNKYLKLFILFIISAGLGNLLNHFYYPYKVIDFINIKGSFETLRIGVFNFADFVFNISFFGMIITLILIGINKLGLRLKRFVRS